LSSRRRCAMRTASSSPVCSAYVRHAAYVSIRHRRRCATRTASSSPVCSAYVRHAAYVSIRQRRRCATRTASSSPVCYMYVLVRVRLHMCPHTVGAAPRQLPAL
jgi:hypothetical protein